MDPSEVACRTYNSFRESKPIYDPAFLPQPYMVETPISLSLKVVAKSLEEVDNIVALFCDSEQYSQLQDVREKIGDTDLANQARIRANPFSKIGNSVFMSKNSIILSNIDAIYKLTGHYSSLLKQRLDQTYEKVGTTDSPVYNKPVGLFREDTKFTYCDVNDERGAFAQYLQYRVKNIQGYAMNPMFPTTSKWNLEKLNTNNFTITYGEDGTGHLFTNWDYFIHLVRKRLHDGVHLTVANGDEEKKEIYNKEYLNSRNILEESLVGIGCCGKGGSFVMKVFDTVTRHSAELLYVLAQCFKAIVIFKPISSDPSLSERYLICLQRRSDDVVDVYTNLLSKVHNYYDLNVNDRSEISTDSVYVTHFLKDKLPESFVEWLTKSNDNDIRKQLEASNNVLDVMNEKEIDFPKYNLRQILKIWNIPGNVPKARDLKHI